MSTFHRLFQPLRAAAAAFFRHDLTLRRDGDAVRLALEQRDGPKSSRQSRAEAVVQREKEELALIRSELAALLNELPTTRQTMRHLVFVEQALAKKGLRALHKIPLDVLQRALEQLEGLVTNWSPVGLANLRSKMAVAIIDREHDNPQAEADAYRTAAVLEPAAVRSAAAPPAAAADAGADGSDEAALAAAYAALGAVAPAPVQVELQGELPAASARDGSRPLATRSAGIDVRVLQP
jgi:hypothetical protein